MPSIFITGPVRSGKSRYAEQLALERDGEVLYVATARVEASDPEWVARLAHHASRRPAEWRVVETGRAGAPSLVSIAANASKGQTLLVDSLGTWLADRMSRRLEAAGPQRALGAAGPEHALEAAGPEDALGGARPADPLDAGALEAELFEAVDALAATAAYAIVVGDETGWGLVPPYPSGRVFRDVLGRAQQRIAERSVSAYLVVAGFALDLRQHGTLVARSDSGS